MAGAAQVAGSGIYLAAHVGAGPQVAGAGAGPHQDPSVWASDPDLKAFILLTPSAWTPAAAAKAKTVEEKRMLRDVSKTFRLCQ